ncbi:stage V sporulation protein AA [Anaerotignum sp.]|uniref:stage V sporulation protein AA n=1 Tax=Anaerotignum sp. TaxID=2039241 RepID=UPI00331F8E16
MDIYIKPIEKAQIIERKLVYLKDIAEVYIGGQTKGDIEGIVVFQITGDKNATYLISVLDVIRAINHQYPDATVSNVGEMDILVEYHKKAKKESKTLELLKVCIVCIILFAGASTTIMCFHSDTQLPLIFQNYYYMFFGENVDMPAILSVPYTIGLAVGVMVFFNHFSKAKITDDPTPIEIEMTTYEKETNASVVDRLNKTNAKGGGGE